MAVIFPDIELWATNYLRAALTARDEPYTDGVYVDIKTPNPRQDRMVVVRRDGGPRLDQTREAARLGVRVWAKTERDATDLARMTRALLGAAADGKPVLRVDEISGPSPVADESGQPLRFFTVELVVRGTDL